MANAPESKKKKKKRIKIKISDDFFLKSSKFL